MPRTSSDREELHYRGDVMRKTSEQLSGLEARHTNRRILGWVESLVLDVPWLDPFLAIVVGVGVASIKAVQDLSVRDHSNFLTTLTTVFCALLAQAALAITIVLSRDLSDQLRKKLGLSLPGLLTTLFASLAWILTGAMLGCFAFVIDSYSAMRGFPITAYVIAATAVAMIPTIRIAWLLGKIISYELRQVG